MNATDLLLGLLIAYVIAGVLLALMHAAGYALTPDREKLATARAWKRQRRALRDGVERMRVEVRR